MPRLNRSLSMPLDEIGVYHCYTRCVQEAYLCGYDPDKKIDYSYRKVWIREKLRRLAKAFAIDIGKYALMSTHLHVILRNRPDISRNWTDQEIARRWWEVCPGRVVDGLPAEPKQVELNLWLSDPKFMLELRSRISDPSWLMRELLVNIARQANKETNRQGKFWDHRFGSRRLLDEAAILACALYVDLNVVRADQARALDESEFTSIYDQIRGRKQRLARAQEHELLVPPDGGLLLDTALSSPDDADAWLGPITVEPRRRIASLDNGWFEEFGEVVWEDFAWSDDELGGELDATICPVRDLNFTPQELSDLGLPTDVSELAKATPADFGDTMTAESGENVADASITNEPMEPSESSSPMAPGESHKACGSRETACAEADASCGRTRKSCSKVVKDGSGLASESSPRGVGWWDDSSVPQPKKQPRLRRASPEAVEKEAEETLLGKKRLIRLAESTRFPAPRASNKGFTSLTFDEYLELAEWVGRQVRRGKRGVIEKSSPVGPANVDASADSVAESRVESNSQGDKEDESPPETLQKVGIDGHGLLDLISKIGDHFGVAVGRLENVLAEAKRVGRNWLWRQNLMARVFT